MFVSCVMVTLTGGRPDWGQIGSWSHGGGIPAVCQVEPGRSLARQSRGECTLRPRGRLGEKVKCLHWAGAVGWIVTSPFSCSDFPPSLFPTCLPPLPSTTFHRLSSLKLGTHGKSRETGDHRKVTMTAERSETSVSSTKPGWRARLGLITVSSGDPVFLRLHDQASSSGGSLEFRSLHCPLWPMAVG